MKVTVSENAGFCFGVERAIKLVHEATAKCDRVVTYGPIIHNPQVVKEFEKKGVGVINNLDKISSDMIVVIRSHGATLSDLTYISSVATVVDATCPFVKKVHKEVINYSEKNIPVVIIGDSTHPEVKGIVSYASSEFYIVKTEEEANTLPFRKIYGVVSQTTQNKANFDKIVSVLYNKCETLHVSNTICIATYKREKSALEISKKVDVMVVVGGRNSSNTSKLCKSCAEFCKNIYHIETVEELTDVIFKGVHSVGLTAGASTPLSTVYQVKEYILERADNE